MVEFYDVVDTAYLNLCKSQTLNVKVRVELLDHYENTVGEITTKVSTTGGSINVKYNQGVRRTCDITISDINSDMIPNNENSPLFVNKKFKIYIGLYKENYITPYDDVIYWFSQGIFITKDCDYDKKNKVLHLTGVDKFGFFTKDLNQHTLQETYHINANSKLGKLISDIITISMGNGMPTDTQIPLIHTSFVNQVLPYNIEKTANETIGDILIEIATAFDADIYYDVNGHLVFEPNIIDDYNNQAPAYEFGMNDSSLLDFSLDFNYGDIVNQITVTGDNTDGAVYSSTAKNENPVSSLRVSNIGIKAADIEETPMGYNEKRCADYANYLLKKKMRIAIAGTISCTPLPHLDCNKIVRVHNNENDVHETDFLLEEVQMPLSPEAYSLSVCNLQDLPLTCYTSGIPQSYWYTWIFITNTNTVGKLLNSSNDNRAILPSKIGNRQVDSIGIVGSGTFEDGTTCVSSRIEGLDLVTDLTIENGVGIIYPSAFAGYSQIQTIKIPESIKSVGAGAFASCSNLQSINIPDGVTDIGYFTFSECTNLKSVYMPNSVVSIGMNAFYNCAKISKITIPDNTTQINPNAFRNCASLQAITIKSYFCDIYNSKDTICNGINNGTSYFNGIIYGYEGSTAQTYAQTCNYQFQKIIGAFRYNKIDSNNVEILASNDFDSLNIKNLNIPTTVSGIPITSIGSTAFSNQNSITSITLSDNLKTIGDYAFASCENLEEAKLSKAVTTIGNRAFQYCGLLSNITIGNNVESIGSYAFYYCSKLKSINIPDSVTGGIGDYTFCECTTLTNVSVGTGISSVGTNAFNGCVNIETISLPNVTGIMKSAFSGCSKLKSIYFDKLTYIGSNAFSYCSSLSQVDIPDSIVTIEQRAFYLCNNLVNITISNNSHLENIAEYTFYGCSNLESVNIPPSVKTIQNNAFNDCGNLNTITFNNGLTKIYDNGFYKCLSLTRIVLPDSLTYVGKYAFYGCTNLESVTISDKITSMSAYAFTGCTNLKELIISDGSENLTATMMASNSGAWGSGAFNSTVTSIIIPSSITNIADNALSNFYYLSDIYYKGTEEEWGNITKGANWNDNMGVGTASESTTIHYNYTQE